MLQQHFQTERPNISPWNQYEGMLSDFFSFSVLYSINTITCHISTNSCRGVVVITSVLHTEGFQFDPGRQHPFLYMFVFFGIKKLLFWSRNLVLVIRTLLNFFGCQVFNSLPSYLNSILIDSFVFS